MDYKNLMFTENFNNKLNCNFYTTIRIDDEKKFSVGSILKIHCKGVYIHNSIVIGYQSINIENLKDFICYLDCGYDKKTTIELIKKMFPKIDFTKKNIAVVLLAQSQPWREHK